MKTKYLKCNVCKNITAIQRKESKNKSIGHIKHMWCFVCKKVNPFIELDEFKSLRIGQSPTFTTKKRII